MKVWTIAYYTALRHVRDVKAMAAFLLLPLIMMLMLGTMQSSKFTPTKVEPVNVGFLNKDEGRVGVELEKYLLSQKVQGLVQLIPVSDIAEGNEFMNTGKINSLIHVPTHLSNQLLDGEEVQVEFYGKEDHPFIQPIVESFIRTQNLRVVADHAGNPAAGTESESSIREVKLETEGKIPTGVDYYAVTTMFQFLLLGALFGVFAVTKDIGNHTYSRFLAAPVYGSRITLGKLLGSLITLYGISMFLFLVSKYVFRANWDTSLWMIMLVLLLFAAISVSLGMIMAYLTKSTLISSLSLFILSFVFTLISGGITPIDGAVFDTLSRFAPNSYGQKILFGSIYDGTFMSSAMRGLALYTGITIILAMVSGRRRVA
ncbi:ABC transporter permease [Paenibacillus shunpengii]|uniref:ABC transporter permease n=1 Tax=Paenibacillus shunpengii TaxID=2054424 RepID=A0ABW5SNC4_9BACL